MKHYAHSQIPLATENRGCDVASGQHLKP